MVCLLTVFDSKHTGVPAGNANFTEMQIKTGRFMFFIMRLTENTNVAVTLPASESVFNCARLGIAMSRGAFAELDIAAKPRPAIQQAFADSAEAVEGEVSGTAGAGGAGGSSSTASASGTAVAAG
jgi:Ras-related GTP-binding protein A/B